MATSQPVELGDDLGLVGRVDPVWSSGQQLEPGALARAFSEAMSEAQMQLEGAKGANAKQ